MSPLDKMKLVALEHNWIPSSVLRYRLHQDLKRWQRSGQGPFPHLLKQDIVLDYASKSGARVLVETGTYYGFMVQACLSYFDKIVSIEIDSHFYHRATKLFRNEPSVTLLHGDSTTLLPEVLDRVKCPCIFWLDAHYSGGLTGRSHIDTPICAELETILSHPCRHIVLIDDAICFDGTHDYPELSWVEHLAHDSGYLMSVSTNIIRVLPQ
jgi:hypothetical protein